MAKKSGYVHELWESYAATLPKEGKRCREAWRPVTEFTGVRDHTVRRWMNDSSQIIGGSLLQVKYFLELLGYEVLDLKNLEPNVYELGALIAYRVITMDDARDSLGYSDVKDVYRLVHGRGTLLPSRAADLGALLELHHDQLEEAKRIQTQRLTALGLKLGQINGRKDDHPAHSEGASHTERRPAVAPMPRPMVRSSDGQAPVDADVEVLAHLIQAMYPLLQRFTANASGAEMRKAVRGKVSDRTMFQVSTMLNQMCNESSFRQYERHRNGD